jgi:hypothetical protein
MKLQPAVKKETGRILVGTSICTVVMLAVFFALNKVMPESVPFGISEIVSGIIGCAAAVGNFFIMGVSVQKVVNAANEDTARRAMTVSFRYRTLMQLIWAIIAIVVPFFNGAAGIIPLFFPSILIKGMGIVSGKKSRKEKEVNV